MRVHFVQRENWPERLACGAELVFDENGPLQEMKLVGFCIWSTPEGDPNVTFPSRAFGAGNDRRYFDYLRSADGTAEPVKKLRAWILDEYRRSLRPAPHPRERASRA